MFQAKPRSIKYQTAVTNSRETKYRKYPIKMLFIANKNKCVLGEW